MHMDPGYMYSYIYIYINILYEFENAGSYPALRAQRSDRPTAASDEGAKGAAGEEVRVFSVRRT